MQAEDYLVKLNLRSLITVFDSQSREISPTQVTGQKI